MRRLFAAMAALFVAAMPTAGSAQAEAWPTRPVKILIPNPPGGGTDNLLRPLLEPLQQAFGHPFVIENRAGASGAIAVEALTRAPKDGYTLLVAVNAPLVILPHVRKVAYDPLKDVAPVAMLAETVSAVGIRPALPARTFKEFMDYCRANPGKVHYSSNGVGSIAHIRNEMISRQGKLQMVHVPYKGDGEALIDLLAGHIDFMAAASVLNFARQGQVRLVAFLSPARHPEFPDIPTMREAGLPDFEAPTWYAMFAPAGTPAPIVEKLNKTIGGLLARPDIADRLIKLGYLAQVEGVDSMTAKLRAHHALYGKVVAEMNIKE